MLLGQVDDLDRLAHVEQEDLAALAHGGGLEHELDGLGDGHEVARHLRVRDGDGPAGGDLLLEDRDDRAGGAEHVAEPDGLELGRASVRLRSWMYISAMRLEPPMMLVGLTALSVEIMTNSSTPYWSAASATSAVPRTLFLMASPGLSSISGTCLWAAAWITTCGLVSAEDGFHAGRGR